VSLSEDPRWRRFNDRDTPCPCCGRTFNGVFDIGYDHPDPWPHGNRAASGEEELIVGEDSLGTDLCVFGKYRFVRCILPIPIIGTEARFAFGPWASLAPDRFDEYLLNFADATHPPLDACFAWLMNLLPGFDFAKPLPCDLVVGAEGQRPTLWVQEGSHELAECQREGITFDRLLDIYAAAGQDIRPHLMDA